jgi:uncharacterized membrane protein YtjA (UPF0391 family)
MKFNQGEKMIRASIAFFILAIVAYVLGAYGISGISIEIGKTLLFIFLLLSVISFLVYVATGKRNNLIP